MVLVEPSRASSERVFSQVALIVTNTGDKGLDDMLECCFFSKKNKYFSGLLKLLKPCYTCF